MQKVSKFERIWCNEMAAPAQKCIQKAKEFEGIWCNQMDTQAEVY